MSFEYFPQIKATKEFVKDVLLVHGGLRHSEQRHTIKSLSDENPYIHSFGTNQSILGSNDSWLQELKATDAYELYIAMRNLLGKDEVFVGSVAYGEVNNFAHFIGIENGVYNRFKVDYIDKLTQLHINANYDRRINYIMSVNINADFYQWDTLVYYKPNFTCELTTPVNLRNKIKVKPTLSYMGKRFYDLDKELPSQLHINLGLYYNYTQNIGAYLQLNNLSNSKEELWNNYREVGFNGSVGFNYSF